MCQLYRLKRHNRNLVIIRGATTNLSKARPNTYSTPNFFDRFVFLIRLRNYPAYFLWESIETKNLDKAQALGALPAVAALNFVGEKSSKSRIWIFMQLGPNSWYIFWIGNLSMKEKFGKKILRIWNYRSVYLNCNVALSRIWLYYLWVGKRHLSAWCPD